MIPGSGLLRKIFAPSGPRRAEAQRASDELHEAVVSNRMAALRKREAVQELIEVTLDRVDGGKLNGKAGHGNS